MRKRQLFIFGITLVVVSSLFATISFHQKAQDNAKVQQEDATRIQIGVMTDRQREHSKLYKGLGTDKKIIDLLKTQEDVVFEDFPHRMLNNGRPHPTWNQRISTWTCNADAVVIGIIGSKESQLTADGKYVFTDYFINLDSILKNKNKESILPDNPIIFSEPGGKVVIDGHLIVANFASLPALKIGEKYLLFLRTIPSTGAFNAALGTYPVMSKSNVLNDSVQQSNADLDSVDFDVIVQQIKASVLAPCPDHQ